MSDTPLFDETNDDMEKRRAYEAQLESWAEVHRARVEALRLEDVPDPTPQPKVVAATAGAGVGSAIGEILVWIIEASAKIDIPDGVEISIGVVLAAGLAFVGGYFRRN